MAKQPPLDPDMKRVGIRIRSIRQKKLKLSQEAFADHAGIDRSYVSGIERGVRDFGMRMFFTLARALGVKPQDLLK